MPIARLFVRTFQPGWLIVKLQEEASSRAPTGTASSPEPGKGNFGPRAESFHDEFRQDLLNSFTEWLSQAREAAANNDDLGVEEVYDM
jgi:hypothetical protein